MSSSRTPRTGFSRLHARRLIDAGYAGTPVLLPGLYAGPIEPTPARDVDPELVVYAGRHVQEKRVDQLVRGFARARAKTIRTSASSSMATARRARMSRSSRRRSGSTRRSCSTDGARTEEVAERIARSACLVTASEREGYGLVVVEAAAHGTPSVVVEGPENAATELVRDGVNGVVSPDASPESLARAMSRVIAAGPALRESTARWFAENAKTLTIGGSLELVVEGYQRVLRPARKARG